MGGAVLKIPGVSLRGPKAVEEKEPRGTRGFSFRCPPHIYEYLTATAAAEGRSMTEIIVYALEMDRDLGEFLSSEDRVRIQQVASDLGLNPKKDMAKVLAGLIRRGLDKAEGDLAAKKRR